MYNGSNKAGGKARPEERRLRTGGKSEYIALKKVEWELQLKIDERLFIHVVVFDFIWFYI